MADLLQAVTAAPWPLLLLPLLARLVPGGSGGREPWDARVDLPLLLVAGLVGCAVFTGWQVEPYTRLAPLTAADFQQYCELVVRVAAGELHDYSLPRSPVAAWPPAVVAHRLGVIDALALYGLLGTAAMLMALFVWGRVLHGRLAGLVAVVLAGALGPLVVLSRDLGFYPVLVAAVAWCAAGAAACICFRGPAPALLAGSAAAVVLLLDVRGLLWALPLAALALVAAVLRARHRQGASLRVALVLAPLLLSWGIARQAIPGSMPSLEFQTWIYLEQAVRSGGVEARWRSSEVGAGQPPQGFLWGHGSARELAASAAGLARLSASAPPELRRAPSVRRAREQQLLPWALPSALGLGLALLGLARRWERALALALTVAPFGAMMVAAAVTLPQARYLASALVALPLVLGVAVAALAQNPSPWRGLSSGSPPRPWRSLALLAALLAAVTGLLPGWLAPDAPWRTLDLVQGEPRATIQLVRAGGGRHGGYCARALDLERQRYPWWPSRLYDWPER